MISFSADAAYGYGGKQFIARITGRHPKFTFAYEFIGKKFGKRNEGCSADVDTPGLYLLRDIDRKGNVVDRYRLVIDGDDEPVRTDKETAMKIAKALDAGRPFLEIVDEDGNLVTPRQAERAAVAQTIDSAADACWSVLQALPQKEAKKVLAVLRLRVSPPPPAAEFLDTTPVGIVSDYQQDQGVPAGAMGLAPTPVAAFAPGDTVVCDDAADGAHFLVAGDRYTVASTQTGGDGVFRVCLAGMARAWEAGRFHKAEAVAATAS